MGFFDFGRNKNDAPVKTASRRGSGAGRTRNTRVDDLEQVRDKRRPQGVTSPIKNAAKVEKTPTSRVEPPKTDAAKTTNNMKNPASGLAKVTGTPQGKTGSPRRNVGSGREKKANVTKEQLTKTGLTLRDYLNFMDKNSRRPTKADAAAAKKLTAGFKAKKAKPVKKMGGGMMKSKMGTKGGAMGGMKAGGMKTKGYKAGGMKDLTGDGKITQKDVLKGRGVPGFKGGGMKTKGYKAGGMKTKGYNVGGMKGKSKVRGAGIARKGVRPAKMI
tara:strand:+ start:209 stop:1024 length:816 start_codon:yes stop_codon:yes gene_type:complete